MIDTATPPPDDRFTELNASLRALGADVDHALQDGALRCGPYTLLEQIGEGGYGVVHAAVQDKPAERRVAVKLLKRGLDTREVLRRFELEQRALARIDHPHVATILNSGTSPDGRPWFAMPLLDGSAITVACDDARMSLPDRLRLIAQACDGVHAAHVQGIVHRDIKPGNVLVVEGPNGDFTPRVIDFGIAKAIEGDDAVGVTRTADARWLGTPAFMAPEQLRETNASADTRSDVYAVGVIVNELLSGVRPPRDAPTATGDRQPLVPSRVFEAWLKQEPDAAARAAERRGFSTPQALVRKLRGDIDAIVARATMPEPERRYQSADALAADLRRVLAAQPVSARAPGVRYVVGKFVSRHRVLVAVVGGAFVTIVALSVWAVMSAVRAERLAQDSMREAQRSAKVSTVLRSVFAGIDPDVAQGRDRTLLVDILGQTSESLVADLDTTEAVVSAQIAENVASAFVALEETGRALALLLPVDARLSALAAIEKDAAARDELLFELARLRVVIGSAWRLQNTLEQTEPAGPHSRYPEAHRAWRSTLDIMSALGRSEDPVAIEAAMKLWWGRVSWPENRSFEEFEEWLAGILLPRPDDDLTKWDFKLRRVEIQPWLPLIRDYPPAVDAFALQFTELHPAVVRARARQVSFMASAGVESRAEGRMDLPIPRWNDEELMAHWEQTEKLATEVLERAVRIFGPNHTVSFTARMAFMTAHGHRYGADAARSIYTRLREETIAARGANSPLIPKIDIAWRGISEDIKLGRWWWTAP